MCSLFLAYSGLGFMEDSFTGSRADISFVNGVVVNCYVLMNGLEQASLAKSNLMDLESGPILVTAENVWDCLGLSNVASVSSNK